MMRAKLNGMVFVFALCATIFAGWTALAQKQSAKPSPPPAAPPKVTWEYKVVSETDKISLNDLGAQGWELVTVEMGGAQEVYYFKRAK
ncbi:MAG: hypothetical protein JOZ52_09220 [Acidobacteria bacterium]|nr:hypothetical protein [Acidobacteriota bacterium]